jgi:hypothetical protein
MVASGTLPFVPDSGGQREVVGKQDALTYRSVADAVETIDRVLSDGTLERRLRQGLPDAERAFGHERFRETIRTVVRQAATRTDDRKNETSNTDPDTGGSAETTSEAGTGPGVTP